MIRTDDALNTDQRQVVEPFPKRIPLVLLQRTCQDRLSGARPMKGM